jgi:uncharacterized repeat protein (TIGR02543 family)
MAAKVFEVGDVLPATTQLRISWTSSVKKSNFVDGTHNINASNGSISLRVRVIRSSSGIAEFSVYTFDGGIPISDNSFTIISSTVGGYNNFISPYTQYGGDHAYCDIVIPEPITITNVDEKMSIFTWEAIGDPIPQGYNVTFEENGGTSVTDLTEQTVLPDPLPTPTKSGYTFVNWYYESNFQTRAVAGDTIESNVTLYAKWHNLGSLFTEIADAIRSKDGTSESIRDLDFGERIKQIQGAKEEETKTVTPDFSSGNVVVTPTSGKVMTQVTINKDSNLIADNIKKDITVHGITGTLQQAKEEQTKTVSPTTSSQDVLPDANKVLSKVTVNAIPTETKSQQPNLASGNQTINATSGKFMTSFTITKDTTNHIASNIRSGKTLYGVTGNLQPAKEEETKTVTPDFSSGNVVVTPTTGKVMTQVTINKDTTNHIAGNIKSGVTLYGVTGTYEGSGGNSFLEGNHILVSILVSGKEEMAEIGPTKIEVYINENLVHTSNEINKPLNACCHFSTPALTLANATFKIRLYSDASYLSVQTIEAYYLEEDSKSTAVTYGELTRTAGSGYVDYTKVISFRWYRSYAVIAYLGLGE